MIKLLLASQNAHKAKEMKALLSDLDIELCSLKDLGDLDDVIEDGSSFFENAQIKARYFAKKHGIITISDDSGLEVYALAMKPGIYSARYSGKGDSENNLKLLFEMKGITDRRARFVSAIALAYPNGKTYHFEGVIEGEILTELRGSGGFGYDPLFYIPSIQKTFAEMDSSVKNQISHRAIALKRLKEALHEIIDYK